VPSNQGVPAWRPSFPFRFRFAHPFGTGLRPACKATDATPPGRKRRIVGGLNRGSSTDKPPELPLAGSAYPECALDLRSGAGASHLPARWAVGVAAGQPPVRRGTPRRAGDRTRLAEPRPAKFVTEVAQGSAEAVTDKRPPRPVFTLRLLVALTLTDHHATQESVWEDTSAISREPLNVGKKSDRSVGELGPRRRELWGCRSTGACETWRGWIFTSTRPISPPHRG
jgi:hypothetical protein